MALPEMEAEEKGLLSQLDASMAAMSDQDLHAFLAVCVWLAVTSAGTLDCYHKALPSTYEILGQGQRKVAWFQACSEMMQCTRLL